MTIENLLFEITSQTSSEPESFLLDDSHPECIGYRVLFPRRGDITLGLIGIMPQALVEERLLKLETELQKYPIASGFISRFKRMIITDYVPGKDISAEDIQESIIKETEYETQLKLHQGIKRELSDPANFRRFIVANQLIGFLHNMKR